MPPPQAPASNTMNANKRKKTSGLTGLELRMAYQSLVSIKSLLKPVSAMDEVDASDDLQSQENLITFDPDFEEMLTKMLEMMRSKLEWALGTPCPASKHGLPYCLLQAPSFSGVTEEALSKLNITLGGSLKLKTDYKVRVAATEELGMTEAVTDGHNWIFLVLKMNSNGDGATYAQSLQRTRLMTIVPPGDEEISRTMCDVIAGIIGYWIEHSNEDIGDDDWFHAEWK